MNSFVSFGWELTNLNSNGADAYFRVANAMTLNIVNIDAALMLLAPTPVGWVPGAGGPNPGGWAEVLCQAMVARGNPPTFQASPAAYLPAIPTPDFGPLNWYNPSDLALAGDAFLRQDVFYSVILKSYVPGDGTASATHRQVSISPALSLNAGDYLVFHMDHAGIKVDCEMQVVLGYALT
jgi:hypothetical protein